MAAVILPAEILGAEILVTEIRTAVGSGMGGVLQVPSGAMGVLSGFV
ncbi:hypothetical protein ACFVTP_22020 [Streptomyces celluloflavus]